MKPFKKSEKLVKRNKTSEPISKEDVKIKHSSWLYFQVGLVVAIISLILIFNLEFEQSLASAERTVAYPEPDFTYTIYVLPDENPKSEIVNKQPEKKPEVKKPTDEIDIVPDDAVIEKGKDDFPPEETISNDGGATTVGEPDTPPIDEGPKTVLGVEMVPIFPGCENRSNNKERIECMSAGMAKIVKNRFNTDIVHSLGMSGILRIQVTFIINKNGDVENLQIRAPHPQLEKEAARVVKSIPKMTPGFQNDKKVDVMYNLPIIFDIRN
ncbi:MAG TPA: energy transducer TonB [Flavobacteriaceae bacterium]|nr:energy transducer TonB [Flavobacteriaceae bacterium]